MGCFLACFGGAKDGSHRRRCRQASSRRASPRRDFIGSKLLAADEFDKRHRARISPRKLLTGEDHGVIDSLLNFKLECSELEKPLLRSLLAVKHAGEEARAVADSPTELKRENSKLGSLILSQQRVTAGEQSTAEREKDELGSSDDTPKKPLRSILSPGKPADEESGTERENHQQGSSGSSGGGARKKVTFDLNVQTISAVSFGNELDFDEEEQENEEKLELEKLQGKISPNSTDFPPNHRYHCIGDDEDMDEDDEYDDCDCDEDEDGIGELFEDEEESYESFFSLPLDKEKQNSQEVNSPNPCQTPAIPAGNVARDRSHSVHSVLNPIENLSQWRDIKALKPKKSEEINSKKNSEKQEVSVDASLSSWLSTPPAAKSGSQTSVPSYSREDQPILGALTVEDIKQSSATSSPRRSPARSPDEIPIVGTVGSYWNCSGDEVCDSGSSRSGSKVKGIPNTTSKYREDKRVNWHSTPFEVRLEKALNSKDKTSPNLSGITV